jgi:hypothetical protein
VGRGLSEAKDTTTPVALSCGGPALSDTIKGPVDTGTDLCVLDNLTLTMDDLIQQLFPGRQSVNKYGSILIPYIAMSY